MGTADTGATFNVGFGRGVTVVTSGRDLVVPIGILSLRKANNSEAKVLKESNSVWLRESLGASLGPDTATGTEGGGTVGKGGSSGSGEGTPRGDRAGGKGDGWGCADGMSDSAEEGRLGPEAALSISTGEGSGTGPTSTCTEAGTSKSCTTLISKGGWGTVALMGGIKGDWDSTWFNTGVEHMSAGGT